LSLLAFILFLLSAYLFLRLRSASRLAASLVEASRSGKPVLLDTSGHFPGGKRLGELAQEVNRLLTENATISTSGQETLARIQTMLGSLREAVLMVDSENLIRMANPAFTELVPANGDPLGRRLDLYIQGEAFHEFMRDVRRDGVGRHKELPVQIDQEDRWLEVSAAPLQEGSDDPRDYTLFVFHDITRQKRLEKMRTEFVANVSHELRTPVTVIKGFAETLIEDEAILTPEEKTRFLKKIRSNSERLHNLLQDLLLLTRLESTEMVLQLEDFSTGEFLQELTESWESVLEEGGQKLVLDLCPGNDCVRADPLRLSQVMTNLLENAVRHARGFTEIRISTRLQDGGVVISVADDGVGIPEKDLPHVFQRFYRVEKGRSRESGGTGLGLSIVKHIVVQHGGEIRARSGKGRGTTIEVFLPAGART
jgi:two-component system phosphate regulon sensor histidine kinase PhoR